MPFLSLSIDLVDLVEVITAAIEVVQSLADAKSIQIETILDTSIEKISGDSDRLQQVVLNLLTNAIKFTPNDGRVKVRLSKEVGNREWRVGSGEEFSQTSIPNYVQIQVSDTGQGISADFLPHVFERFCQADSTHTRSNKGLGLGLAIARHVVELHGGTIQAQSQGIGSRCNIYSQVAHFRRKSFPLISLISLISLIPQPPYQLASAGCR